MTTGSKQFKSFADLPLISEQPTPTPLPSRRKQLKSLSGLLKVFQPPPKRELVAGGEVLWRPVDKQAALLLAKASAVFHPPTSTTMSKLGQHHPSANPAIREIKNEDGEGVGLDNHLTKLANKLPAQLEGRIDAMKAARMSLDVATDLFRRDMIEFSEELPKHTEKLRQWRMMVDRERDLSIKALRELRMFFLDSEHEKEMQRLNDFVRMAERLGALAKDGTLQAVADVMLKLAVKPE